MSQPTECNYNARREVQERAASAAAADPVARQIHVDLANRYAERCSDERRAMALPTIGDDPETRLTLAYTRQLMNRRQNRLILPLDW